MTDYVLEILDGDRAGETVRLAEGRVTIGRKPSNQIVIADEKASGQHAEVVAEGERWVLRDLGSTNGTLLDGHKVTEVALSQGDTFQIGRVRLRFRDASAPTQVEAMAVHRIDQTRLARTGRRRGVLLVGVLVALAAAGGAWAWQLRSAGATSTTGVAGGRRPVQAVAGDKLPANAGSCEEVEAWRLDTSGAGFELGGPPHSGFSALQAYRASGDGGTAADHALARLNTAVATVRGERLRLTGWLRATGGARAALRLRFTSSAESDLPALGVGTVPEAAEQYTQVTLDAAVPPGMDRVEVEVLALLPADGADAVVDDLALVAGGDAAPIDLGVAGKTLAGTPAGVALRAGDEMALLGVAPLVEGGALDGLAKAGLALLSDAGLTLQATATAEGFHLTLSGAEAAGWMLWLPPASVASGVLAQTAAGTFEPVQADFNLPSTPALLVGSGISRLAVGFAAPAAVQGVRRGDDFGLVLRGAAEIDLQVVFAAAGQAARAALLAAQQELRAGQPGAALDTLQRACAVSPHDDALLAQLTRQRADILLALRSKLEQVRADLDGALFFGSRTELQRLVAEVDQLVRTHGENNLPDGEAVRAMRASADQALADLDAQYDKAKRVELDALAEVLSTTGDDGLRDLVTDYIRRRLDKGN